MIGRMIRACLGDCQVSKSLPRQLTAAVQSEISQLGESRQRRQSTCSHPTIPTRFKRAAALHGVFSLAELQVPQEEQPLCHLEAQQGGQDRTICQTTCPAKLQAAQEGEPPRHLRYSSVGYVQCCGAPRGGAQSEARQRSQAHYCRHIFVVSLHNRHFNSSSCSRGGMRCATRQRHSEQETSCSHRHLQQSDNSTGTQEAIQGEPGD